MRIEKMGTDDGKTRFVDTKTGDIIKFPGGDYSYLTFCYPNPKEGDSVEIEKRDNCLYVHKANNENSSRMSFEDEGETEGGFLHRNPWIITLIITAAFLSAGISMWKNPEIHNSAVSSGGTSDSYSSSYSTDTYPSGESDSSDTSSSNPISGLLKKRESKNVPEEYKKALETAQKHVDYSHGYSKHSLYNMLTNKEYGDKFSAEAADYAVKNVKADWKENAYYNAKTYKEYGEKSNAEIERYMRNVDSNKFSDKEIDYAIEKLNREDPE